MTTTTAQATALRRAICRSSPPPPPPTQRACGPTVIYRLAAFLSVVDDDSESGFESLLQRHLGRHDEQMADQRLVLGGRVAQLRDRLARDHEEVSGSLRAQIAEGNALIILVEKFRRNLAASDLAWSRGTGQRKTAGANRFAISVTLSTAAAALPAST